ncbi:MAG: flippase [Alphaproteobacteria bacterium]
MHQETSSEPAAKCHKPWHQLLFVLGEAVLTLLSGAVLFVVVSHVGGPELLGTYALAFAWLALFQGLSSFGIPEFLMREVGSHGQAASGQVFHTSLLGLASGVAAIALMAIGSRLLDYPAPAVEAVSVAALAVTPGFLNMVSRSVFLALRRMHWIFLTVLVEVTIAMSASLYLLLSGYGASALMGALVAARLASALISQGLLYRRVLVGRQRFDAAVLRRIAGTVFTFGVGNMLGMLTMRVNTILVSAWADVAAVGHFAAATKIMEIGLIIPSLFSQLLMSRIAYSFNIEGSRDPNRFGAWYEIMFALVIPFCVGIWIFAEPILRILFGTGFEDAAWVLRILMLYLLIESAGAVMSVILLAAQRQRQDVIRLAFNPLTNIALSLMLLPFLGMVGAAIGRLAGAAVTALLRQSYIARELTPIRWLPVCLAPMLISTGVGAVCYVLLDLDRPAWLVAFYLAATGILIAISSGRSLLAVKDIMSTPAETR